MTAPTAGILVIFGITGDLARKKLLPALGHLAENKLLPEHFEIIGVTRRKANVAELTAGLEHLAPLMSIVTMDPTNSEDYSNLKLQLDAIEDKHQMCLNRLFYLAIPPTTYGPVVDLLGKSALNSGCAHGEAMSRIMVEKPFGYDLTSATELIERLKRSFKEEQIYRIDHYLAKETAQNILTFRFSNPIFESAWNRKSVSRIVITASEAIGIEGRVAFYEPTGALRDLIQSHLLQVLALVAMEQPETEDAASVHIQKLQLLEAIKVIQPDEVGRRATRGQYQGYLEEVENPNSHTETFARLELAIGNDRWRGVPIIIQTGKRLQRKTTEVTVEFGDDPHHTNTLTFRLQPDEGIAVDLLAKKPGFEHQTERVAMNFDYHHHFGEGIHPDAYERVLMDGIRGDQTLFATSAEVLAAWRVVEAVVKEWAKNGDGLIEYETGTVPDAIK